jgi:phospholipid/cholesterol/gamma-HCH transport system permease protein
MRLSGPVGAVAGLGETLVLGVQGVLALPKRPLEVRAILQQIYVQGNRAFGLMILMSAFAGLVMAYQFGLGLSRFGAQAYIGQLTVLALTRELMPVLSALVLGGRIVAGISAELGAMAATEQVAAVRALGADPVKKLVLPRIVAATIVLPLFTILGDVIGAFAGALVAQLELHIPVRSYIASAQAILVIPDFISGVIKSAVFGFIAAAIACRTGLASSGGATGVGKATTKAVVQTSLTVVVLDFFLTRMMAPWLN